MHELIAVAVAERARELADLLGEPPERGVDRVAIAFEYVSRSVSWSEAISIASSLSVLLLLPLELGDEDRFPGLAVTTGPCVRRST